MSEKSEQQNEVPSSFVIDDKHEQKIAKDAFWDSIRTLFAWRRFIISFTTIIAIAAIVISLLMPNWYKSSTRLLLPEGGGGGLSSVLGSLSSLASLAVGGGGGDYIRYISIMTSRGVMEKVVDEFDLINHYELQEARFPKESALTMLSENVDFIVDAKYDYMSIDVLDTDPEIAAQIANFIVNELNIRNTQLKLEQATNYRKFIEKRYFGAEADLDSARYSLQEFQEKYGVLELETQVASFYEALAGLKAEVIQAEIQAEALENQFGAQNAQVRTAIAIRDAGRSKIIEMTSGQDMLMPIALNEAPAVGREYSEKMQQVLIHAEIVKFVRPAYEQALFDEQRQTPAIQVLDVAIPPALKNKPRRSIIVIVATFSGMLLAMLFVFGKTWVDNNAADLLARLKETEA